MNLLIDNPNNLALLPLDAFQDFQGDLKHPKALFS